MYTANQTLLVNDTLNLLRGKLVRFILEDGDMRMIANLVAVADEMGLEYDQESMTYRDRKAEEARRKSRAQLAKELEPGLNALFGKAYTRYGESVFDDDEDAPELEPEEELDDELQEAFDHAWDREARKDLRDAREQETKRQERNRKARERYHAKKKGKANGSRSKARKTARRQKG